MFEKDYSTYEGCMELVEKIRRHWARQGLHPTVIAVRDYVSASATESRLIGYKIASDMVGGWPRGKGKAHK
jgi:hypothetical protein